MTVQRLANNFEARVAGSAIVANNLAARLDAVREDALYARVLFLFLGLPGAILAMILTFAVSATGGDRRRREQALLRVRGATTPTILRLESLEAVVVSIFAVILALIITWLVVNRMVTVPLATRQTVVVIVIALLIGIGTALAAVIIPAWREARESSVRTGRARVGRGEAPFWERTWIDLILLAIAGLVYWRTAAAGYQIVLAPEGVAATSVSYESFLAPLALWIGVALLVTRIFRHGLAGGRAVVAWLFRPLARALSPIVAASVSRQARLITRGVVLVTLAFSFAVSTAVFNTTYNVQSRVDAALTNGSDVTVTGNDRLSRGEGDRSNRKGERSDRGEGDDSPLRVRRKRSAGHLWNQRVEYRRRRGSGGRLFRQQRREGDAGEIGVDDRRGPIVAGDGQRLPAQARRPGQSSSAEREGPPVRSRFLFPLRGRRAGSRLLPGTRSSWPTRATSRRRREIPRTR